MNEPGVTPHSQEIFSRKQLAWMGLFLLAVLLVVANWEFSYSESFMEEVARSLVRSRYRDLAIVLLNVAAVTIGWIMRARLGALFAVAFGSALNEIVAFIRRV